MVFAGWGEDMGGGEARVSDFFTKNPNLKKKNFGVGVGGLNKGKLLFFL